MTHARTFPRYVGIAGLVAGLLAPVSSLAAVNTNGIEILSTTATGVKNGQYIEAAASVAYQHVNTAERIYTRQVVPVARSTLRKGALAALGRGLMHPGLQLAIAAAGWAWSMQDGIHEAGTGESQPVTSPDWSEWSEIPGVSSQCPDALYTVQEWGAKYVNDAWWMGYTYAVPYTESSDPFVNNCTNLEPEGGYFPTLHFHPVIQKAEYTGGSVDSTLETEPVLVPESDYGQLDEHLPSTIVDDLWFDDESPYPWEWADTNDAIDPKLNDIEDAKGSSPPEVRQKAKAWAENVAASLEGKEPPNPDTDADGKTADEAMYESTQEPIPPFGEVEPEWQVETIDSLPDYDIGLGSGSCPAPTAITLPAPFNSVIELDWQPVCDFASMIRGAVIAVCMILSLYIVLRSA
ncbi:virulence factor TspB C-terminal domain-related protein [Halomonas beimenensis]|uniref:Uncharacterized protein n=1 Tax=Halomonas beimenensis TaxID=475662 RepID=A0A291P3F1_9GAMM|nr:virulence factor TspB C-terminal domain-related protein [Halomonas beimenensis]ATJ81423.1 hypothetical protein BEI_0436 [Halomonas beimenensis]